MSNDMLNCA